MSRLAVYIFRLGAVVYDTHCPSQRRRLRICINAVATHSVVGDCRFVRKTARADRVSDYFIVSRDAGKVRKEIRMERVMTTCICSDTLSSPLLPVQWKCRKPCPADDLRLRCASWIEAKSNVKKRHSLMRPLNLLQDYNDHGNSIK